MPTVKKPASTTAKAAKATSSAKPKASSKKPTASTVVAKVKKSVALTPVVGAKPMAAKAGAAPKKATAKKTIAGASFTQTTNPRTSTATIKKITRNIVGFYMTEDIEIRRITRSDNMSNEKLKAKYAQLKTKIKSR